MVVIKLDCEIERYKLEQLGELYKKQIEQGVVVLPKGATIECTSLIPEAILVAETIRPLTWREKLFGCKPLEEVRFIEKNNPVKPKPPEN